MNNENVDHLIDGKYAITDLVDLDLIQNIFQKFTNATGFTIGFLDHPKINVLVQTGWRDICTVFHRGNPIAADNCYRSNKHLLNQLSEPGKLVIEACDNGLVDCATPIIIKGKHIASLATGQLVLEEPDIERFKKQAQEFGFDEQSYLKALEEVPVVQEEKLKNITSFLGEMAFFITELGYNNLKILEEKERLAKEIALRKKAEAASQEQRDMFQTLFEQAADIILLMEILPDGSLIIRNANSATSKILGYDNEELVGMPLASLDPDTNAVELSKERRKNVLNGNDTLEVMHVCKNGEIRDFECSVKEITLGNKRFAISIERDVTERRKLEQELAESEAKYRALIEQSIEGIGISQGNKTIYANRALLDIFGYDDPDEFLSIPLLDSVAPAYREEIANYIETTQHKRFKYQIIRKDGVIRDLEAVGSKIEIEGEVFTQATFRDITDSERAKENLKKSEAQLSNAMQMAQLGHWEYDVSNDLFTFSDHFYKIFRTSAEQVGGYSMSSNEYARRFVHPDDWHLVGEEVRKAIKAADPNFSRQLEHRMIYADGTIGYLSVRFFIVKNNQGWTIRAYGVNQDITERKSIEQERKILQEQLAQSQKMESIGRLAGGIAHDFNNLLTAISGFSDIAYDSLNESDPVREDIAEIQNAAESAAALTKQLLAFSRKQIISPRVMDLNRAVEKSEKMLRRIIGEDIDFVYKADEKAVDVFVDPEQINQILVNLVVNSRDAMPNGGKLTIEIKEIFFEETKCISCKETLVGKYAMLAVSDNGVGMDAETIKNVFEPFYTTKEKGKGTGLGLATVHGIVHQSKGHIGVYSELGMGTTFKMYFPSAREAVEIEDSKEEPSRVKGHETIMLVEDQDTVRKLAKKTLSSYGYKVVEAKNGEEAFTKFKKHEGQIEILLTDVVLPQMNGNELYKHLAEIVPDLKVLYMSGYTENTIAYHGVLDKSIHFIQKPFRPLDLVKKIRQVLDS